MGKVCRLSFTLCVLFLLMTGQTMWGIVLAMELMTVTVGLGGVVVVSRGEFVIGLTAVSVMGGSSSIAVVVVVAVFVMLLVLLSMSSSC